MESGEEIDTQHDDNMTALHEAIVNRRTGDAINFLKASQDQYPNTDTNYLINMINDCIAKNVYDSELAINDRIKDIMAHIYADKAESAIENDNIETAKLCLTKADSLYPLSRYTWLLKYITAYNERNKAEFRVFGNAGLEYNTLKYKTWLFYALKALSFGSIQIAKMLLMTAEQLSYAGVRSLLTLFKDNYNTCNKDGELIVMKTKEYPKIQINIKIADKILNTKCSENCLKIAWKGIYGYHCTVSWLVYISEDMCPVEKAKAFISTSIFKDIAESEIAYQKGQINHQDLKPHIHVPKVTDGIRSPVHTSTASVIAPVATTVPLCTVLSSAVSPKPSSNVTLSSTAVPSPVLTNITSTLEDNTSLRGNNNTYDEVSFPPFANQNILIHEPVSSSSEITMTHKPPNETNIKASETNNNANIEITNVSQKLENLILEHDIISKQRNSSNPGITSNIKSAATDTQTLSSKVNIPLITAVPASVSSNTTAKLNTIKFPTKILAPPVSSNTTSTSENKSSNTLISPTSVPEFKSATNSICTPINDTPSMSHSDPQTSSDLKDNSTNSNPLEPYPTEEELANKNLDRAEYYTDKGKFETAKYFIEQAECLWSTNRVKTLLRRIDIKEIDELHLCRANILLDSAEKALNEHILSVAENKAEYAENLIKTSRGKFLLKLIEKEKIKDETKPNSKSVFSKTTSNKKPGTAEINCPAEEKQRAAVPLNKVTSSCHIESSDIPIGTSSKEGTNAVRTTNEKSFLSPRSIRFSSVRSDDSSQYCKESGKLNVDSARNNVACTSAVEPTLRRPDFAGGSNVLNINTSALENCSSSENTYNKSSTHNTNNKENTENANCQMNLNQYSYSAKDLDGNEEEANKCLIKAQNALAKKDFMKAKRFAERAQRLFPSVRAKDLLRQIEPNITATCQDNTASKHTTSNTNCECTSNNKSSNKKSIEGTSTTEEESECNKQFLEKAEHYGKVRNYILAEYFLVKAEGSWSTRRAKKLMTKIDFNKPKGLNGLLTFSVVDTLLDSAEKSLDVHNLSKAEEFLEEADNLYKTCRGKILYKLIAKAKITDNAKTNSKSTLSNTKANKKLETAEVNSSVADTLNALLDEAENQLSAERYGSAEYLAKEAESLRASKRGNDLLARIKSSQYTKLSDAPTESSNKESGKLNAVATSNDRASTSAGERIRQPREKQVAAIHQIMNSIHDHEKLGVTENATESDIRKAQKKFYLLLHSDKNVHPDADTAFMKMNDAVANMTSAARRRRR